MKKRLLALVSLASLAVFGQQPATFRANTALVEFSIVALDDNGAPVTDLKADEIQLRDDGEPRELAFLNFEGKPATKAPEKLAEGVFSNRPEYTPGPARNVTAIVLDTLNTRRSDQVFVKAQVVRYLREIAPGTRIAIYRLGDTLQVIQDFTDDAESLRARLAASDAIPADGTAREMAARDADLLSRVVSPERRDVLSRTFDASARAEESYLELLASQRINTTLAMLEMVGDGLAGIPGRKSVVWISGGIPVATETGGWVHTYESDIRDTARRLAGQGITMYTADAGGLQTDNPSQTLGENRAALERQHTFWAAMDILAHTTGGRAFRNSNDRTEAVHQAVNDMRGTYTAAFYTGDTADGRWRRLRVETTRPGVQLQYKRGYQVTAAGAEPGNWTDKQWRLAVGSPIGSTAVGVDATCEPLDGGGYAMKLRIAGKDLAFRQAGDARVADIDVVLAQKGSAAESDFHVMPGQVELPAGQAAAEAEVGYMLAFRPRAEATSLRLLVRDRVTGQYGTLDIPMDRLPAAK